MKTLTTVNITKNKDKRLTPFNFIIEILEITRSYRNKYVVVVTE